MQERNGRCRGIAGADVIVGAGHAAFLIVPDIRERENSIQSDGMRGIEHASIAFWRVGKVLQAFEISHLTV